MKKRDKWSNDDLKIIMRAYKREIPQINISFLLKKKLSSCNMKYKAYGYLEGKEGCLKFDGIKHTKRELKIWDEINKEEEF